MPTLDTLHATLLSRTMDKCSTWFCSRSSNNNISNYSNSGNSSSNNNEARAGGGGALLGKTVVGSNSGNSGNSGNSNTSTVTFFDAISSNENGTVTTVLAPPRTSATIKAGAAATAAAVAATPTATPSATTTSATTSVKEAATGAKSKQINYEDAGPSPSSSVPYDDTEPPPKNCYRLVMLGSSRTGKTSLVQRFLGQRFHESYTPTIEDFHRKLYRIRSEVYQLDILDTSGNHPFPAMRRLSFLTGDIFVLVFSMDSRESFEEVVRLREQILETKWSALAASTGRSKKNLPRVPMVIAGNKCDREMKTVQIDEVMGYIAGQDSACVFVECSAKKNFHVEELFYELFMAANLPQEMAPNHHRWVSTAFGAPSPLPAHCPPSRPRKCTLSIKRRLSDACGVVAPNVRRPSIRTDLMLMRTKTCSLSDAEAAGSGRSGSSCNIM